MFDKRQLIFLVTFLAMIAFTATAYTFNPPQQRELPLAAAESSTTEHIYAAPLLTHSLTQLEPLPAAPIEAIRAERVLWKNEVQEEKSSYREPTEIMKMPRGVTKPEPSTDSTPPSRPSRSPITCSVTTNADSGAGSLRQCLLDAVAGDTINFDPQAFPPNAPATITLLSSLPTITSDNLTIDGSNAGVILDGSGLATGSGLEVDGADGVTLQGLQIIGFPWDGITLLGGASDAVIGGNTLGTGNILSGNDVGVWLEGSGTTNNIVLGNYIGTNATGTASLGNQLGILIGFGAQNNIVGGSEEGAGNLISGNMDNAIHIQSNGTTGNQVLGNYIGTDVTGMTSLANQDGVVIIGGAQNNLIGGAGLSRNIISGNTQAGIQFQHSGTSGNQVLGNYIGTDLTGIAPLGNESGIFIANGATDNIVGDQTEEGRNLISGNTEIGLWLYGPGTNDNQVLGNYIGTNITGTASLSNKFGILIGFGAQNNLIGDGTEEGRNLISGNMENGIHIQDSGTTGNQVLGNYIGTDVTGTAQLSNQQDGVLILGGPQNNIVGGAGTGNLISGNMESGIDIQGANTNGNQVLGNYIGTDASGTLDLGNEDSGVSIAFGAQNNIVGGVGLARNVISGNGDTFSGVGIQIQNEGTNGNQVLGNYIGTDASGMAPLGNAYGLNIISGAQDNFVGGATEGAGNIISGNTQAGIQLAYLSKNESTSGNQILGNYIGTDLTGAAPLSNTVGILIGLGAQANIIGGAGLARNVISGNGRVGIELQDTSHNQVLGNYIGTDRTGMIRVSNGLGIFIADAYSNTIGGALGNLISGNIEAGILLETTADSDDEASYNQILGNTIGTNMTGTVALSNTWGIIMLKAHHNLVEDNLISGNTQAGIVLQESQTSGNQVLGNYIGTDAEGTAPLGNILWGVNIGFGAQNNLIEDNLISGNTEVGIQLQNSGTSNNQVLSNYIGTNITGTAPLSNTVGIGITSGAENNLIESNLISGNTGVGIQLQNEGTIGNVIESNYIGTNAINSGLLGNGLHGLYLRNGATENTIGISNTIAYNGGAGVAIEGENTLENTITRNSIYGNDSLPIDFVDKPVPIDGPELCYEPQENILSGTVCSACRVEIFGNPKQNPLAGTMFLGEAIADNAGNISIMLTLPPDLPYLSANLTDLDGTTSEFSSVAESCEVTATPTPTNTPTVTPTLTITVTPTLTATVTVTPTLTPNKLNEIYLPLLMK